MLFTLIKNEFIKLFKRSKTWIVFALFVVCIVGVAYINNVSAKETRRMMSPEGQIEMYNQSLENEKKHLESIKNIDEPWVETEIASSEEAIKHYEEQIKIQEEKKNNPDDPDIWRKELKEERENIKTQLEDETVPDEYKTYEKQRLQQLDMYLDKDIKPVQEWEFNAESYLKNFMQVVGLIILVAGISVFMSDIVSGEATPPTMKFLLVQPISRGKVLLSKFITVVLTVLAMISGLELIAFGVVGAIAGFDGMDVPTIIGQKYTFKFEDGMKQFMLVDGSGSIVTRGEALMQSFALQALFIVACCAMVFLISAVIKSSMITMAISVIVSVASTMICMMSTKIGSKVGQYIFLNYGNTPSVISGDVANMFRNPNFSVELGVGLMVGTIVVSYLIAHIVFSKKDILI